MSYVYGFVNIPYLELYRTVTEPVVPLLQAFLFFVI